MKISALTIYLINLCDNLRIIAISCAILPVLLVVVLIVSAALADDELDPAWMKRVGIGFAISMFFFGCFAVSENTRSHDRYTCDYK